MSMLMPLIMCKPETSMQKPETQEKEFMEQGRSHYLPMGDS